MEELSLSIKLGILNVNILQGDSLEVLRTMESGSIDMCITSPPYWGLRDYGVDGQIGQEPSYQEYISKLVYLFNEVKRVLKDTGTCWVNIGDTYSGGNGAGYSPAKWKSLYPNETSLRKKMSRRDCLPGKSLVGIPERFAIAMTDAGWIRRNTIIWHKSNCMPFSGKDRFTVDFEYMYFFTKNKKYYFKQQLEKYIDRADVKYRKKLRQGKLYKVEKGNPYKENTPFTGERKTPMAIGRNKRTVWTIPTKSYKGAHFAVFPEALVKPPVLAGCPEGGTVLDPFMGSGTTLKVAGNLGRHSIGIELNPEYIELAKERIIRNGKIGMAAG